MGIPVLVFGKSGVGKSYSLRNFEPEQLGVIRVIKKPLPFRSKFKPFDSDDYKQIMNALFKAKTPSIVIDDAGYLTTNEFMRRALEKGYDKFTEMAKNLWNLISFVSNELPEDKIVYIMMHEDKNDMGDAKVKTIGRMLDEKVCVEGMFTIVLHAMRSDGKYLFKTQGDGSDIAKSPYGMFQEEVIENDLKHVDDIIREFYGIEKGKQEPQGGPGNA